MNNLLKEISLDKLVLKLINTQTKKLPSLADYQFAKNIIENSSLSELRPNSFCIDLTYPKLNSSNDSIILLNKWDKSQCKAFKKLFSLLSNEAAILLEKKQTNKTTNNTDVEMLWLKLPKQNESNLKLVNKIVYYASMNGYQDKTGNEKNEWISLKKFINNKKSDPVASYTSTTQSISLVITTDTNKVLLLKRAGASARAGSWGTLTGRIEWGETAENAVIRECHEEVNYILNNQSIHYLGIAYTPNLGKDLAYKNKQVSYSDDCSYVYGVRLSEEELKSVIKISDDENSKWKLFDREQLKNQFASNSVALIKSLGVLDAAQDNFKNIESKEFIYPYTNSVGFFVHHKTGDDDLQGCNNTIPKSRP